MRPRYLRYQVLPSEHLPAGLAPVTLTVLSPIWQGPEITLVYPDGWEQRLSGLSATQKETPVRIFWTEAEVGGPPVCLAIGGAGGLRLLEGPGNCPVEKRAAAVRPFLALATGLIPAAVREVIGPEPPRSPRLLV